MVLRASHTLLPAAGWYAAKVFSASSRAKKLMVLNFFNLRALVICSCHLSLSQPFAPFLKLICFTNPFLHSLSGSFWTAFTDFNLFLAFVCFDFYYTFLFLATCARLSWLPVHSASDSTVAGSPTLVTWWLFCPFCQWASLYCLENHAISPESSENLGPISREWFWLGSNITSSRQGTKLHLIIFPTCFLPARRYASAGNSDRNLSVRPSVTRRYCVKTEKASDMISSPSNSPKTLVFRRQISSPISKGLPPNGGLKQGSVGKIQRFFSFKRLYLENGSRYGQSYY